MKKTVAGDFIAQLQDIADHKQEHFICFSLDVDLRIIKKRVVFIGTLTSVISHPREVFAGALEDAAFEIVVAHNHPSGDVEPSKKDIEITQNFIAAGQLLGIPLHDHIIVSGKKHFSFRGTGLIGLDILTAEEEGIMNELTTN